MRASVEATASAAPLAALDRASKGLVGCCCVDDDAVIVGEIDRGRERERGEKRERREPILLAIERSGRSQAIEIRRKRITSPLALFGGPPCLVSLLFFLFPLLQ